jgi:SAM-dependent methyltransferase
MTIAATATIDEQRLGAFVGRVLGDLGATLDSALVVMGDSLGLYRAMADGAPRTSTEVAEATGVLERYVREWLNAQASGGYVEYDAPTERYRLPAEHALALTDETSPWFLPGAFQLMAAAVRDEPRVTEAMRQGRGLGWHEHSQGVFDGCERFFRPGYAAHLVSEWIPALGDVADWLAAGAAVADVGCGHGASTLLMAAAYPASRFLGVDYHAGSIESARQRAADAGLGDRVRFEVATADGFAGRDLDLVTTFDCLHDMGDPVGAARHIRTALAANGRWLVVEPFANDRTEDNMGPIGRIYYAASVLLCTPASLSQAPGMGLGAQAGEARLRQVIEAAGFTHVRRVAETPFNLVLEARP